MNDINDGGGGNDSENGSNGKSIERMLKSNPPPNNLPHGWFLKPSHSFPGYYYYFNQETGECCWDINNYLNASAAVNDDQVNAIDPQDDVALDPAVTGSGFHELSVEGLNATAAAAAAAVKSILKRSSVVASAANNLNPADSNENTASARSAEGTSDSVVDDHRQNQKRSSINSHAPTSPPSRKKIKTPSDDSNEMGDNHSRDRDREKHHHHYHGSGEKEPKEVRVLHILKKHRGSRRPSSWRNSNITDSKEKVGHIV